MENRKQNPAIFYIFYFAVFLGGAIHGSFMNMYLSNAGMKSDTIGLVNGIIQMISLLAFHMPIFKYWKQKNRYYLLYKL